MSINSNITPTLLVIENYFLNKSHPKDFHNNINQLNASKLKEILSLERKENPIKNEKIHQKTWKNPGFKNDFFSKFDILKPKILNTWDQARVNMPIRSYEKYSVDRSFKIQDYGNKKEFGFNQDEGQYNEQYVKYLRRHTKKYNDYIDRPSKYLLKKESLFEKMKNLKRPFKIKKSEFEMFNQPRHNAFIYESKFRIKND